MSAENAPLKWHMILLGASLFSILLYFISGTNLPLLIAIAACSLPLLWQIFRKLLQGDFGADILAALALVTAVALGEYLAAVLIIIMLAGGQALEAYAMRKASAVLMALASRMPTTAHRRVGTHTEEIAVSDIAIGDFIVIFPHETCPVDGVVMEGHGSMDESYLTGEPYRVSKATGASVLSGAINGDAALVIQAEKIPADSRYAKIMGVMQDAEQKRPRLRRLGDQVGAVFAPLSLALAIGAWWVTGDATRFLAVLVVATPCPLLIAIPVAIISAVSMAAKRGIIIKDPTVLERLPTCRTAIFDKTGTLTYGKPELTEILTSDGVMEDVVLQQAASLERYSKHPLAHAILQAADKQSVLLLDALSVSEKPGQGLTGMVSGKEIRVTHRRKLSPEMAAQLPPTAAGLECVIFVDGAYAATFRFRDAPRADGKSFITHLGPAHQFTKVMLVSGDRESEVAYLAGIMGIKETLASQTPEQKLALVRAEAARAPTLFMGDGINDAPALAAATVGLAFGQGSEVTSEAAGAVILDNTLEKVDELLHLSIDMRKIALQCALGGMTFSIVGMGFAAAGYVSPVAGALLQEAIDVVAILWALRLIWQGRVETDMR